VLTRQSRQTNGAWAMLHFSHRDKVVSLDEFLYEETPYSFRLEFSELLRGSTVRLEPSEFFEINDLGRDGELVGRFLPGDHVGSCFISAHFENGNIRLADFKFDKVEIRSKKLDYEDEYQQMLNDIAERSAEALLDGGFLVSDLFTLEAADGHLDLTALCFLANRLESSEFKNALAIIKARPDMRWIENEVLVPLGKGLSNGKDLIMGLSQGGRKIETPSQLHHLPIRFVPEKLPKRESFSTFDSLPNQFVRFVLLKWQSFAVEKMMELESEIPPGQSTKPRTARALQKLTMINQVCATAVRDEPLRSASDLSNFPQANTVLTSRPGYRDVFRLFLKYRLEATLAPPDSIDPFSISKRSVSALYEMWCYLEVLGCLERIIGRGNYSRLFKVNKSRFSLNLVAGDESRVEWEFSLNSRRMNISLWYNKTFGQLTTDGTGSWSEIYKPDISLHIRPVGEEILQGNTSILDTWLHFDAKYKLTLLGPDDSHIGDIEDRVTKDDMNKMHTYRDAIVRSAGAYVLFPGSLQSSFRQFEEILPGIGAFPLRPHSQDSERDKLELEIFLREVIEHCCNQATNRERTQYWQVRHNSPEERNIQLNHQVRATPQLTLPPADTMVLVGYIRSPNVGFVRSKLLYNLRADSDRDGSVSPSDGMLAAPFVLLWSDGGLRSKELVGLFRRTSNWYIANGDELSKEGYSPSSPTARYFVSGLSHAFDIQLNLLNAGSEFMESVAPRVINWAQLMGAIVPSS
jgi:predicted component of viral defense system (DUF524 family)